MGPQAVDDVPSDLGDRRPRYKRPLKTYSRRINSDQSAKKRLLEETTSNILSPKPIDAKKTTISDYFKPTLPSPNGSRSSSQFTPSEALGRESCTQTPPSSPPITFVPSSRPSRARRKIKLRRKQQNTMAIQTLRQTVIDAGQSNMKRCKKCGMVFCITEMADQVAHDHYHERQKYIIMPKPLKALQGHKVLWNSSGHDEDFAEIVLVDNRIVPDEWKVVGQVIIDHVNTAIGGPEAPRFGPYPPGSGLHFRLFMLIVGKKVVGVVLCEPTNEGVEIVKLQMEEDEDGLIPQGSVCGEMYDEQLEREAEMGVSRLWVAKGYRRQNCATKLMDIARENFVPGKVIAKKNVAYTDLTDFGGQFVDKYHADSMVPLLYIEGSV